MRRERAADLAFIGACLLLLAVIGYRVAAYARPTPRADSYRVGDTLSDVIPADAKFERALVLIVHSKCSICTESMPFYRSVAAERAARTSRLSWFVLAREDPPVVQSYLGQHRVTVDRILPISHEALKGAGFPTLMVIDGTRTISGVWRGRLSPTSESKVIEHAFRD